MAKHIISKNPKMTKHVTTVQVITNTILKFMVPAKTRILHMAHCIHLLNTVELQ